MVEDIECLGTKLQSQPFVDRKLPANCTVHLPRTKTTDKISRGSTPLAPVSRNGEGIRINRLSARVLVTMQIERSTRNEVQPGKRSAPGCGIYREIAIQRDGKGSPGSESIVQPRVLQSHPGKSTLE